MAGGTGVLRPGPEFLIHAALGKSVLIRAALRCSIWVCIFMEFDRPNWIGFQGRWGEILCSHRPMVCFVFPLLALAGVIFCLMDGNLFSEGNSQICSSALFIGLPLL